MVHPSTNPYSSAMVMLLKKEGNWCMYPNFYALIKSTIKDKFPSQLLMIFWMNFMEPSFSLNLTFIPMNTKKG